MGVMGRPCNARVFGKEEREGYSDIKRGRCRKMEKLQNQQFHNFTTSNITMMPKSELDLVRTRDDEMHKTC
jgi:hypothetical protein